VLELLGHDELERHVILLVLNYRTLKAFNSLYSPEVILEGESRSLLWPLATTLFALCPRRMKTPNDVVKVSR
jgi:hypothetical protein